MFTEIEFTGRCPSKAQIKKAFKTALRNHTMVVVSWGENSMRIERIRGTHHLYCGSTLDGYGWIRRHGGQDLAQELFKEGVR